MIHYCFMDGPLQGQTLESRTSEPEGAIFDVQVVDIDDSSGCATQFAYRVVTASQELVPGTLRYVGATY